VRVVEELLAAGIVPRLAVVSPALELTDRGRALARDPRLADARSASDPALARVAATDSPQGIVLAADIPSADPDILQRPGDAIVLVLDAVQDPGNFGTLLRSADAFGVRAVIALPGTVDAWNPKTVRAAAGSAFRVPILYMATDDTSARLGAAGYRVLVADADGQTIDSAVQRRVALVVGNEGAGVSEHWHAAADAVVAVRTPGPVESLNVAVATGILLYTLRRETRERID
jgi:TrmH family RNA methyltransferase